MNFTEQRDNPPEQYMGCNPPEKDCTGPAECREGVHLVLRRHARALRDRAHAMDLLADELEHRRFSSEAEALLWQMAWDLSRWGR